MSSFLFPFPWFVSSTTSICSLTFLGTPLGDNALPFLAGWDGDVLGRSLEVLISVSLSNVPDLPTVTSAVCLSSGWLLLVGKPAELALFPVDGVFCLCKHSITAVRATWCSRSSKSVACCDGVSVVLSCTDDFLPALPEWSSLSNTEWWVSTGSLSPIEFIIILYIIRSKSKLDTFQRRNRYFPFFNWIS